MTHNHNIRVYYEDTDAAGVVYYANYLKYTERARTEMLSAMGFSNTSLQRDHNILFVVRDLHCVYHKPARLEDELTVTTRVIDLKNSSLVMEQLVTKSGDILVESRVTLVCIDDKRFKPVRFPVPVKVGFEKFLAKEHS